MKDKVQKILSEITTRKLCTMDEHMAFYNDKVKEDYKFLSEIEELIKALQKEQEVDLEDDVNKILEAYDWKYDEIDFFKFAKHFYDKGYFNGHIHDGDRIEHVDGRKVNVSRFRRVAKSLEEPVSEDLEDAVDRWYNNEAPKEFEGVLYPDIEKCAKHFAEWQKEQMMSKAIPAEIDSSRSDGRCIFGGNFARFETGEKVKVIVIKED